MCPYICPYMSHMVCAETARLSFFFLTTVQKSSSSRARYPHLLHPTYVLTYVLTCPYIYPYMSLTRHSQLQAVRDPEDEIERGRPSLQCFCFSSHSEPLLRCTCTLHPTPYTLHPATYTLHPTPCALHPELWFCHALMAFVSKGCRSIIARC